MPPVTLEIPIEINSTSLKIRQSVETLLFSQHQLCSEVGQHRMPSMPRKIQSKKHGLLGGDVPFLFSFFSGGPYVIALHIRIRGYDSIQCGYIFVSPRARVTVPRCVNRSQSVMDVVAAINVF